MADVVVTQEDIGWATSGAQHLCAKPDQDAAISLLASAFARNRTTAFEAGLAEGRKQALDEAAEAYRAEAETWNELGPRKSVAVRRGIKVIRAIGDKPQEAGQ